MLNLLAQFKATKLTAAGMAWVSSFLLVDLTTGQIAISAVLATVSAVLAAWLASRPALMNARTAAGQQHTTEAAQIDARMERMHAREVQWLQSRITWHAQALVLTRQSKHNLVNYIDGVHKHVYALRAELKGAEVPAFEFKYYDELCGEEDRALAALTLPAEFQPPATGEMQRVEG